MELSHKKTILENPAVYNGWDNLSTNTQNSGKTGFPIWNNMNANCMST